MQTVFFGSPKTTELFSRLSTQIELSDKLFQIGTPDIPIEYADGTESDKLFQIGTTVCVKENFLKF